ncbi:MAG TPA: hypothetical protein VFY38_02240 [Pseudonocardia sp.]|nr:hypothetical protein [Pseudonocardia sp.]
MNPPDQAEGPEEKDERADEAAAAQPTRRRIVEWLRRLWNRPVGEATKRRLTSAQRLLEGVAVGLVVALLATTLPAAPTTRPTWKRAPSSS